MNKFQVLQVKTRPLCTGALNEGSRSSVSRREIGIFKAIVPPGELLHDCGIFANHRLKLCCAQLRQTQSGVKFLHAQNTEQLETFSV